MRAWLATHSRVLMVLAFLLLAPAAKAAPAPAELVYSSDGDLVSIAGDGSARTPLAPPPRGYLDVEPAWAPDGSALAFVRARVQDEDDTADVRLIVSGPDGRGQTTLIRERRGYLTAPAWAPDGRNIAFVRVTIGRRGILSELVVVGRDGTGERVLVTYRVGPRRRIGFLQGPAWSPDGGTIAYTRVRLNRRSYFRPDLRAVGSNGSGDRLLIRDAADADWSPDGARIAYTSIRDRNGKRCGSDECQYASELYVMDASGSGQVRLTRGEGDEWSPDWSPDGRWIAFASDRNYPAGEHLEIYSIRSDGACLDWLTNGSAESMTPAWRPVAAASGDPGTCGASRRPALSEVDVGEARAKSRLRLWWVGPSFGALIPGEVDADRNHAYLFYDDCIRFHPDRCPPFVAVSEASVCEDYWALLGLGRGPGGPRRWHGALLVGRPDSGRLTLLVSRTVVYVDAGEGSAAARRNVRRAVRALRPLGVRALPRRLPAPAIPVRLAGRLRREERLTRALGLPAAARRLPVGRAELRDRLRLLDTVRAGDRLRTVRCSR